MENEIIGNKKMYRLLTNLYLNKNMGLKTDSERLKELFSPQFQIIEDCIILKKRSDVFVLSQHPTGDKTHYEASWNEVQLDTYFFNPVNDETLLGLSLIVIDIWIMKLRETCPNNKVCFIISCGDEQLNLRFHIIREDEPRWLNDDLEAYKLEAIGYMDVDL